VELGGRAIPISYLVPKGREDDARRTFARTPDMIRHFSEVTGVPYPWNKYAQVVVSDFIFGGMENTKMCIRDRRRCTWRPVRSATC